MSDDQMTEKLFIFLMCHFIGDYMLQSGFLARTKGENLWHMIAHCVLYTVPFYCFLGFDWYIPALFLSHFIIDTKKARWNTISYLQDQLIHIAILAFIFFVEMTLEALYLL